MARPPESRHEREEGDTDTQSGGINHRLVHRSPLDRLLLRLGHSCRLGHPAIWLASSQP
jgi:hypothetical protein